MPLQISRPDVGDFCRPGKFHDPSQFGAQNGQHPTDAFLTKCTQPPHLGTTDTDGPGTQPERLENIRSASETTVYQYRYFIINAIDDLGQTIERGAIAFCLPTTMIRNDNSINTVLPSRVFGSAALNVKKFLLFLSTWKLGISKRLIPKVSVSPTKTVAVTS